MQVMQRETVYSVCGRFRISYRPSFSESLPWVRFTEGTAGRGFKDLPSAITDTETRYKGVRINIEPDRILENGDKIVYWPHHSKATPWGKFESVGKVSWFATLDEAAK